MPMESFDVVVIGSGAAGFAAVEAARGAGASVCVIEKQTLGGECANEACVPSKASLRAAAAYREVQDAKQFGVTLERSHFDFVAAAKYRDRAVESIIGGDRYAKRLQALKVTVIEGTVSFEEKDLIDVGGRLIRAKSVV